LQQKHCKADGDSVNEIEANIKFRTRLMANSTYPQEPAEWQSAIQDGIGVSGIEGQRAYRAGKFPYEKLEQWIQETFSEDFSPDFVPALLRNVKGLVAWVYGDGGEPSWPGSDTESENPG
jgi:hypothetical protein